MILIGFKSLKCIFCWFWLGSQLVWWHRRVTPTSFLPFHMPSQPGTNVVKISCLRVNCRRYKWIDPIPKDGEFRYIPSKFSSFSSFWMLWEAADEHTDCLLQAPFSILPGMERACLITPVASTSRGMDLLSPSSTPFQCLGEKIWRRGRRSQKSSEFFSGSLVILSGWTAAFVSVF